MIKLGWIKDGLRRTCTVFPTVYLLTKLGVDINMRAQYGRVASGSSVVVVIPSTRAETHMIVGAISFLGIVNIKAQKKIKVDGSHKRKTAKHKRKQAKWNCS